MRSVIAATLLTALCFTPSFATAQDKVISEDNKPRWKVVVELNDTSRLVGIPLTKTLRWKTDDGERELPVEFPFSAESAGDTPNGRTWKIDTYKKDIPGFSGQLLSESFEMTTLFGPITVPAMRMVRLDVYKIYEQINLPHAKDLVLYYSFDENGGEKVRNVASFRHTGQVSNAKWIPNGKRGGAYEFDGQSAITVPHHEQLCPKEFTVSAWIKPNDPSGPWRLLISKTNTGSWYGGYGFYRNAGLDENLYWYVGNYYSTTTKDLIDRDEWLHIAGTFDGKHVRMYLNGEPSQAVPLDPTVNAFEHTSTPLVIGGGGSYPWQGQIDEVMVFRRALTIQEIEKVMVLGLPEEDQ